MSVSLRRRFVFTVGANLLRSALSFATGVLLARSLGPVSFGTMAFLLGTFIAIRQMLDLGTSTAFYTFMSQRPRSKRHVVGFFAWLVAQLTFALLVVGAVFPSQWIDFIWRGEHRGLVLLAFVAAFMQNSVWPVIQQIGESQRQTVWVQSIGAALAAAHLLVVVLLWYSSVLGLHAIFIAIVLEYLLAAAVLLRWLPLQSAPPPAADAEPVWRSYFRYCLPLFPYSCVGFAYEFADRWLLQSYGGSVQQAYYAVSAQFASIALIATSSILNIFWKEIAEAHYRGDHARTHRLYTRISRSLFLVGAIVAGFLSPWAADLLRLLLGATYVAGASTLVIMFLYPVHQSLGQITGTMMYATERVMLSVVAGIIFMLLSIGVTYLVLAPPGARIPGLGLASTGLALKMVGLQVFQTNIVAYMIARLFKWPFDWVFQPVALLGCLACGWLAHVVVVTLTPASWPTLTVITLGGVSYAALIVAFVYLMPWLTGLTRNELVLNVATVWRRTSDRFKPA